MKTQCLLSEILGHCRVKGYNIGAWNSADGIPLCPTCSIGEVASSKHPASRLGRDFLSLFLDILSVDFLPSWYMGSCVGLRSTKVNAFE